MGSLNALGNEYIWVHINAHLLTVNIYSAPTVCQVLECKDKQATSQPTSVLEELRI